MTTDSTKTKKKLAVHLGDIFRKARQEAGLTQADVAERVDTATEVYGRVERGNLMPSIPKLRRLCAVLRVDANAALNLSGRDAAAWLKDATPGVDDPPQLRRLLRNLRQLDEEQLAAINVMVLTLTKLSGRRRQPQPAEDEPAHGPLTS